MPADGQQQADIARWFPRNRDKEVAPGTFEIGLVLAGAVSAGAYTAGVLDFLFEALDTWHAAKLADVQAGRTGEAATVPHHDVLIRIVAGASAGGMNGAIMAASLGSLYPHVRASTDAATVAGNPFYAAWVRDIDITTLLGTQDLKTGFHSVLDCSVLEQIVRARIEFQGQPLPAEQKATRGWIANPLPILLTVGNLRGVPYDVRFRAGDPQFGYAMMRHRDHVGFAVPNLGTAAYQRPAPDLVELTEPRRYAGAWQALGQAALATGAFPAFLAARPLNRHGADYAWRGALYSSATTTAPIFAPPTWPDNAVPGQYDYLCVDGGTMDNEPFELARTALAGVAGENPPQGIAANRAVLLIDPFVEPAPPGPETDGSLFDIPLALVNAYKNDARCVPQDFDLILNEDIYSRYLIAPSRSPVDGKAALASGGLGGFFGFFSEAYRRHDFLLGRRNCQRFLQTCFTLPAGNPVFAGRWSTQALNQYRDIADSSHLQIVPCVGDCTKEEVLPDWPIGAFRRGPDLDRRIAGRLDVVAAQARDKLAGDGVAAWFAKRYLDAGLYFAKSKITDMINTAIDGAAADVNVGAPESRPGR